jgi:uncharacterized phiE125 gp8 family phage protein
MREYVRADGSELDTTIANLLKAAREACQNYQNRAYYTQTWELSFDTFPCMPVRIPLPPLQSVVSVKCTDSDGKETAMDINDFIVDKRSEPGRITLKSGKSWPYVKLQEIDSVVIQFIAGFTDITKVSNNVKLAYMLYITWFIDHPDATEIPQAFYDLLAPERLVPV